MNTNPIKYRADQNEVNKSRIQAMADLELEKLIEESPTHKLNAYARTLLRERKSEEKSFTRGNAIAIGILTAIITICAFLTLMFQLSGALD
jgi:hypothetical protein